VDGTTSGGSVDSTRVNAALLAEESQHTHYSPRTRINSPMLSGPPVKCSERMYEVVRCRRRCGVQDRAYKR